MDATKRVKEMIEELMSIYVSMPSGKLKTQFNVFMYMLRQELPLKSILNKLATYINATESTSYGDATKRETDKRFWKHISDLITSHLK